jgi:hypothetical protein
MGPESDLEQTEFALKQVRVSEGQDRATRSGSHARASTDRLTVFLTDQNFRTADSTSKVETVEHKAGDVAWGMPIEHSEQNLCNEPFEAMASKLSDAQRNLLKPGDQTEHSPPSKQLSQLGPQQTVSITFHLSPSFVSSPFVIHGPRPRQAG